VSILWIEFKLIDDCGIRIRGVSWLSTDDEHSAHICLYFIFISDCFNLGNHTLLSLWRTYVSLDPSIDVQGRTTLQPPRRLFFPNIPYFTTALPDKRSKTGVDELTSKAAFPTLSLMYRDDWEDFAKMDIPFILERVVVADRGAAARASKTQPVFAPPFQDLEASKYWFEPVRRTVNGFLRVPEESQRAAAADTKPVVTYLSTQEKIVGPRLSDEDHHELVGHLNTLHRTYGYEVNVVAADVGWAERMRFLVRSTVSDLSFMAIIRL
jgi:hypothetical protein